MSVKNGIPAPSPALLRYLKSSSESLACHHRHQHHQQRSFDSFQRLQQSQKPSHRNSSHLRSHSKQQSPHQRRSFASSACTSFAKTSSAAARPRSIDDIYRPAKHAALPAPRYAPSPPSRKLSSDSKPSFWSRIFHRNKIRTSPPASDPQSYEETSAQLFNLSRSISRHTSTDQKLRCTEFDHNGNVTLVSGEFKKSELIAKYGLLPRDLRKIDSSVLPHILVRPTALLINLLHLRVLIQSDRVLVFDAYGSTDSYTQSLFMYDLEGKLRQRNEKDKDTYLPYEFRAVEAVLISVTSGLEAEFALVREPVTHILRALEEDIDREKLRHLLIHSKKLGTFEQKARLVRDSLDELLEADDDLAAMYLTERKQTGKPRAETDHTEIEMLLESYHKICDEVVEISGNLISSIRNTEEVVKAILDANRNQLMLFEIKVSIATLGLAGGTLIAGFYGMNLENFIEETNWGFAAVTGTCIAFSVWTCLYGLRKLRKVQKVRMWNEGVEFGPGPKRLPAGRWRNEALEATIQEEKKRKMYARTTVGAGSGPVLWPGMDGLGLHKLNSKLGDVEDTNSDADDFSERRVTRVVDDKTLVGGRRDRL